MSSDEGREKTAIRERPWGGRNNLGVMSRAIRRVWPESLITFIPVYKPAWSGESRSYGEGSVDNESTGTGTGTGAAAATKTRKLRHLMRLNSLSCFEKRKTKERENRLLVGEKEKRRKKKKGRKKEKKRRRWGERRPGKGTRLSPFTLAVKRAKIRALSSSRSQRRL